MKIVLVTGGFDPLHSGHIEYFKAAKQLGNLLIVGINSDAWLARKKGRAFMPAVERKAIIENLYQVHKVIEFDDRDGSAIDAIRQVKEMFPRDAIVFANGGDRTKDNIPEMVFEDVEFVFGVGGTNKANSSSWILEEWRTPKTGRAWGYYRVLHEVGNHVKLKELTVNPKTCLSMQRHQDRAEHWFVAEGTATVYSIDQSSDMDLLGEYTQHQHIHINRTQWHKLCNETDQPLRVIEIQYGENCIEEDIERK
jgi:D-beta-D-heptose 7-phosphate kinase/D-beta-D-heptose 1-phosphate adenosyltransferase